VVISARGHLGLGVTGSAAYFWFPLSGLEEIELPDTLREGPAKLGRNPPPSPSGEYGGTELCCTPLLEGEGQAIEARISLTESRRLQVPALLLRPCRATL